jgi:Uri superfamily endonuclease
MTKGAYCLIMRLPQEGIIPVGARPPVRFPAGYYCYVGSAMNSLEKRLCRHRSRHKKLHWHIDWFLEHAYIADIKSIESKERIECGISHDVAELADGIPMKGFGSSDCTSCEAHLYHFRENPSRAIDKMVRKWKSSSGPTERTGKG